MSLTAALNQMRTVISSSLTGWKETDHRNSRITNAPEGGSDKTFNIVLNSRSNPFAASANTSDTECSVIVELRRNMTGGSVHGHDRNSVLDSLEDTAFTVSERLQTPANWDFANTGIILINDTGDSDIETSLPEKKAIWRQVFNVRIRRTSRKASI